MLKLDTNKFNILMCDETPEWRTKACSKEPETIQWIEEFVKEDDVFLDVGACCGAYSLYAAKQGAIVYAFEPAITNFVVLIKNVDLNSLNDKIKCFPFALGDYTAPTTFSYKSLEPGSTHDRSGHIKHWTYQYRLDHCVAIMRPPNHVKIDVDGYENQVIEGMKQWLLDYPPNSMQIEIVTRNKDQIIQWLRNYYGYTAIKSTTRNNPEFVNVLFVRK